VTRVAYLDCVGGLAGDMLLAALLDAGADERALRELPAGLGIGDVRIDVSRVERNGVPALYVDVVPPADAPPRTWRRMRDLVASGHLPDRARVRALAALDRLAHAEARIHGIPVDDVHFHELGGVDTLVDVCGAGVLLESLGIDEIACSPLPYTRGLVRAAHGVLPSPAPATVELLRGAQIQGAPGAREAVTPTGAALAITLASAWGPPPLLALEAAGYGAGRDDPPEAPNVVRVLVGTTISSAPEQAVLVETNLDDLVPELVPDAAARCFAEGALDVWVTPVQMKKGRPGVVLSALCRPGGEHRVATALFEESTALGVRVQPVRRYELDREHRTVSVTGGEVRVKIGLLGGRVVNVAPEHDDCAALARAHGKPVKAVWAEALAAARTIVS
jgi:uncharacterized protein (TIGR00299 family) protein